MPEDKREQLLISEGHLLARTALQASLDSADRVARTITTAVVMRQASWLHLSGFPKEVQATVADLLFKGPKLFSSKTNESLQLLKDLSHSQMSWHLYVCNKT